MHQILYAVPCKSNLPQTVPNFLSFSEAKLLYDCCCHIIMDVWNVIKSLFFQFNLIWGTEKFHTEQNWENTENVIL